MKLYCIACEALAREAYYAAARSKHSVEVKSLHFGLHNTPDDLRKTIQGEIDGASEKDFEYILLAYGLCSRGTAELTARNIPLVIPRAHDCITMYLGSKERYAEEFREHPGTYYYSAGWVERKEGEMEQGVLSIVKDRQAEERFQEYVEKYGEENAAFLLEQEQMWTQNYNRAAFIDVGLGDVETYRDFTHQVADSKGWSFEELAGDLRLMDLLMSGDWDPREFLVVNPGEHTCEDVNQGIIRACSQIGGV
jgi:hypothetical protein